MKIRNNKTNIEITSPHICKGSYNGKDVFLDENFEELFYAKDGWEEVKEEPNDGWHDLRKNPNDLPNNDREVIVAGYYDHTICDSYVYNVDFYAAGQWQMDMEIVAWHELPTFNKD